MTARERILALRLMEKMEKDPGYVQKLGVSAAIKTADMNATKTRRDKNV